MIAGQVTADGSSESEQCGCLRRRVLFPFFFFFFDEPQEAAGSEGSSLTHCSSSSSPRPSASRTCRAMHRYDPLCPDCQSIIASSLPLGSRKKVDFDVSQKSSLPRRNSVLLLSKTRRAEHYRCLGRVRYRGLHTIPRDQQRKILFPILQTEGSYEECIRRVILWLVESAKPKLRNCRLRRWKLTLDPLI